MSTSPETKAAYKAEQQSYIVQKGGCESGALKAKYAVRLTPAVKETIAGDVTNDPVAKQYIPQARELQILPNELLDPIGDDDRSPVKGIVHRYPDRVLLMPANICAVYCRYCFRREKVGPGGDILSDEDMLAALDYIRSDKNIWEVILTGGDPLILSARKLGMILDALEEIDHVKTIRIHTRIPIADPARINADMLKTLKRKTPIYIVAHINHAQEISPAVKETLAALHAAGCVLLSQSVLLKGVNDTAQVLEDLFKALISLRVKPYYLHHPDKAPGTSHFRLSLSEGRKIYAALQGTISGIALPQYMIDLPGGFGKTPINPLAIEQQDDGTYLIEDYNGVMHRYEDEAA